MIGSEQPRQGGALFGWVGLDDGARPLAPAPVSRLRASPRKNGLAVAKNDQITMSTTPSNSEPMLTMNAVPTPP